MIALLFTSTDDRKIVELCEDIGFNRKANAFRLEHDAGNPVNLRVFIADQFVMPRIDGDRILPGESKEHAVMFEPAAPK